jgi:hypothetical protein
MSRPTHYTFAQRSPETIRWKSPPSVLVLHILIEPVILRRCTLKEYSQDVFRFVVFSSPSLSLCTIYKHIVISVNINASPTHSPPTVSSRVSFQQFARVILEPVPLNHQLARQQLIRHPSLASLQTIRGYTSEVCPNTHGDDPRLYFESLLPPLVSFGPTLRHHASSILQSAMFVSRMSPP